MHYTQTYAILGNTTPKINKREFDKNNFDLVIGKGMINFPAPSVFPGYLQNRYELSDSSNQKQC